MLQANIHNKRKHKALQYPSMSLIFSVCGYLFELGRLAKKFALGKTIGLLRLSHTLRCVRSEERDGY